MRLALLRSLFFVLVGFTVGCPASEAESPQDLAAPTHAEQIVVGAFADCTPSGYSDVVCASGLRCGIVKVGDPPYAGYLSKCVPTATATAALDEPCQFAANDPTSPGRYHADNCAPGLGCVETETKEWRCRRLCELRRRNGCGEELCVLPTEVSGTGYCAAQDKCQPVFPQRGCGRDPQGQQLGCYVLADDKGGGTFCLRMRSYGQSPGDIDSPCERSTNCQPGLGCTTPPGKSSICRPYCAIPDVPDLGSAVPCANDLGVCHPIATIEEYGRCY